MKDIKNLKGQTDSIVLYVLLSGDRHTDELKELIDSLFSEVKIGTLYSVISRLKTQQFINEYRASSSDGSRRKYYKITEKGKKEYEEKYAYLYTDSISIPVREEPEKEPVKPVKEEKQVVVEKKVVEMPTAKESVEDDYSTYIHSATVTDKSTDIDFSMFEDEEVVETQVAPAQSPTIKTEKDSFTIDDYNLKKDMEREETPVKEKVEINADSISSPDYDYGLVLSELFPKTIPSTPVEAKTETVIVEEKTISDMGELYELAEKDGIKIRTSNDTNRYQGTKILINLLRFHTSLIWLCLFILEYIVVSLVVNKSQPLNISLLTKTTLFLAIIPAILGVAALINSRHSVKDMFKFKDVLTISFTIMITIIIVVIALAVLKTLDYTNYAIMFTNIVLPIIISVNIPLFFVIEYSLAKLEFYQVI